VLKDFCTVNLGVLDGIGTAVLNETLYNHIRSKIEVVVADSAANEILAADIGRGRRLPQLAGGGDLLMDRNPQRCGDPPSSGGDSGNPLCDGDPFSDVRSSLACLTPNLMLVGRDLAHGFRRNRSHNAQKLQHNSSPPTQCVNTMRTRPCKSPRMLRRILQRLYDVDSYMDAIMTDTVLGKKSVAQTIWNSHVFIEWFQINCKDVKATHGQGNRVKNLKASRRRFESYQKPSWTVIALVASCYLDNASDRN
jgi:hypothetical protein